MSKHTDPAAEDHLATVERAVDAELADLLGEARRLETADTDPRRGRWPASDYY
jgi:hypothetical protein